MDKTNTLCFEENDNEYSSQSDSEKSEKKQEDSN